MRMVLVAIACLLASGCKHPQEGAPPPVTAAPAKSVRLGVSGPGLIGVPLPEQGGPRQLGELAVLDAQGQPLGGARLKVLVPPLRAVLLEVPPGVTSLTLSWAGAGATLPEPELAWDAASEDAPLSVEVARREIAGGQLRVASRETRTLHPGRLPRAIAHFPPGYLAGSGLFGTLPVASALPAGLRFMSQAAEDSARAATFRLPYPPEAASVPDLTTDYEAWLYDRCASLLVIAAHTGDQGILTEGYRACSYYARQIGDDGFFVPKGEKDEKYSHARGLYLYYALTGDPAAASALGRIAAMWAADPYFAQPYRQGHARGPDKLWTERKLAAALEAAVYAHLLTGDAAQLAIAKELFATLYRHIGGSATKDIVLHDFPPQDCLVHADLQHEGDGKGEPWCSPWMSALLVDPLLRYQALTGDARVDEVFIRLARFLRDTGTQSFTKDPVDDTFLAPTACFKAGEEDARRIEPVYGAGRRKDGSRYASVEWDDFEHCVDAQAITGAALAALRRKGWDEPGVGPFATQGASILALHHELLYCAERTFADDRRPHRDPDSWKADELAAGEGKPDFVAQQKIGWPIMNVSPLRKLGWWFNSSLEGVGLALGAGVDLSKLQPGQIQPRGCP